MQNSFHFLKVGIGKPHFGSTNLPPFPDSISLDRPMGDISLHSLREKHFGELLTF
jgi:hypothetical protein